MKEEKNLFFHVLHKKTNFILYMLGYLKDLVWPKDKWRKRGIRRWWCARLLRWKWLLTLKISVRKHGLFISAQILTKIEYISHAAGLLRYAFITVFRPNSKNGLCRYLILHKWIFIVGDHFCPMLLCVKIITDICWKPTRAHTYILHTRSVTI